MKTLAQPTPVFLGYAIKNVMQQPDFLKDDRVREICNASRCISKEPDSPEKWSRWTFNPSGWYDTPELAQADSTEGVRWSSFAFALVPMLFGTSGARSYSVRDVLGASVDTLPSGPRAEYRALGFDVVSCRPAGDGSSAGFDCSPLSCNSLSLAYAVNAWCLLDSWDEAFRAATDFGRDEPEPGPYVIMRVFRAGLDH